MNLTQLTSSRKLPCGSEKKASFGSSSAVFTDSCSGTATLAGAGHANGSLGSWQLAGTLPPPPAPLPPLPALPALPAVPEPALPPLPLLPPPPTWPAAPAAPSSIFVSSSPQPNDKARLASATRAPERGRARRPEPWRRSGSRALGGAEIEAGWGVVELMFPCSCKTQTSGAPPRRRLRAALLAHQ